MFRVDLKPPLGRSNITKCRKPHNYVVYSIKALPDLRSLKLRKFTHTQFNKKKIQKKLK
jgi:hypothetical protein